MLFKVYLAVLCTTVFSAVIFTRKASPHKKNVFSNVDCDTFHAPITNCAFYIFIGEDDDCDTWKPVWQFADYFVRNIAPNASNIYGIRAFADSSLEWCDVHSRVNKDDILEVIDTGFLTYQCDYSPYDSYYTDPFVNLLNITQTFPNVAVFIQGETDQITDLSNALSLANQLAQSSATIYVWDTSANGDQTGLFATLTGNQPGHIITSAPNLQSLIQVANQQMFPDFLCRGCGTTCQSPIPSTPQSTIATTTVFPSTPSQTNSSCVSLELIFILDRSESVIEDFYNNNVTSFVLDIASQFTFFDEASPANPAYARFGVIQFADDPVVSVPLGNYSRQNFQTRVLTTTNYTTGGISGLVDALNSATNQFQQNSILGNRAIILVINDISMVDIKASRDAIHRLENYVNLPMGVITPGLWGNQQQALSHLQNLLDNRTNLAFPSLNAAESGISNLIDSTFPCEKPPACSALIFIEEASEAIGSDSKLMFLKLAQQIALATSQTPNQRFGLAFYAVEVYQKILLQTFDDFNKTVTDFINVMTDANFPNGGRTYLQPILSNLNTVLTSGLYKNYAVVLMGEIEAIKDVGKASPLAKSIGTLGADIYVIDESVGNVPFSLWTTLTNNAPGHILSGVGANQDSLFANLTQSLIPEFNAMGC